MGDGLIQDILHVVPKAGCFTSADPVGRCKWMDAGCPQDLIGVDVPDTSQKMLIQKQGFDASGPGLQEFCEFLLRDLKGFRAQIAKRLDRIHAASAEKHHVTETSDITEVKMERAGL